MKYLNTSIWFYSSLSLTDICQRLEKGFNLNPFEYDMENLYHWGESESQNSCWSINISCKHCAGIPILDEPFHLLFAGDILAWEVMAIEISQLIGEEIFVGEVRYLGGDDYQYIPHHSYKKDPLDD